MVWNYFLLLTLTVMNFIYFLLVLCGSSACQIHVIFSIFSVKQTQLGSNHFIDIHWGARKYNLILVIFFGVNVVLEIFILRRSLNISPHILSWKICSQAFRS